MLQLMMLQPPYYRAIVFAIYEIAKVDKLSLIYKFYLQFIVIITYSPSNRK